MFYLFRSASNSGNDLGETELNQEEVDCEEGILATIYTSYYSR